jgi:hypothetical protein
MKSFLIFLLAVLSCNLDLSAANFPNIVIILTDDQGYADIRFNPKHPMEVSTPHMDALAQEGVFFTQTYTVVSRGEKLRRFIRIHRWHYAEW